MSDDYYEILGIPKNASSDEIKKAYRKKAMEFHPDHNAANPEAEEMFKKISQAYEVLADSQKKAIYDRVGPDNYHRTNKGGYSPFDHFSGGFGGMNFGAAGRQNSGFRRPPMVADIKVGFNGQLKQIIAGAKIKATVNRKIACDDCKGLGRIVTTNQCSACNGTGSQQSRINIVQFVIVTTCESCGGTGRESTKCDSCNGQGFSTVGADLSVTIPKNIAPLSTLKITGKGNEVYYQGTKVTGDLYVVVDYSPTQDGVTLDNGSLYVTIMVPFDTVINDKEITIDIFGCKKIHLKLDHTNASGHRYVVKNAGLGKSKNAFVKVFIDFPKNKLSRKDKDKLVKTLGEIYGKPDTTFQPVTIAPADDQ